MNIQSCIRFAVLISILFKKSLKKQIIDLSLLIAGIADIFERPNKKSEETRKQEEEKDSLLKTIGEQKVEIDFLKKKYKQRYTATIQSCRTCLQGFKHFKAVQAAWDFTEPVLLRTGLRA